MDAVFQCDLGMFFLFLFNLPSHQIYRPIQHDAIAHAFSANSGFHPCRSSLVDLLPALSAKLPGRNIKQQRQMQQNLAKQELAEVGKVPALIIGNTGDFSCCAS